MNRGASTRVVWMLTLLIAAGSVGLSTRAALRQYAAAQSELSNAANLADLVSRIGRLRRASPAWSAVPNREGPLAPRLSESVARSGLPTGVLLGVTADAPVPLSGEPEFRSIRRQRALVQLGGLTLPQLGNLLTTWREREPAWVITAVEISPDAGGSSSGTGAEPRADRAGTDLPLRVVLVLETVLPEQGGPA